MFHKAIMLFLFISQTVSIIAFADNNPFSKTKQAQFRLSEAPDLDMFLGRAEDVKVRKTFGQLEVHELLTKCLDDPLNPKKKGAVLTDLNAISFAILKPNTSTSPSTLKDRQWIFYIIDGKGIIESSGKTQELREGIGVIMPPNLEFKMVNTGEKPLRMYIIEEPVPEKFRPNKVMIVRDAYKNQVSTNTRRVEPEDWLFSNLNGLSVITAINPVVYEPQSYVQPHVHPVGVEEVWFAIEGQVEIIVGNQRRTLKVGSAYKPPSNGKTPHTNVNNTTVSKRLMWIMKVPEAPQQDRQNNMRNLL